MTIDQLASAYKQIVALVQQSNEPRICWRELMRVTRQDLNVLVKADVEAEIDSVSEQLHSILKEEPLPRSVRCLYFGLFDEVIEEKVTAGYYVSGWTGLDADNELTAGGQPPYFPVHRYIRSRLLDEIKNQSAMLGHSARDNQSRAVLEYAVMFVAAALLSRFAAFRLGITLPIYVGFDSGDFARVAN